MKAFAVFTLLFVLSPSASAICVVPVDNSEVEKLQIAKTVFVATITKASLGPDYEQLRFGKAKQRDRPSYTVEYEYEVAFRIKGDPTSVPFLATSGTYNDPRSEIYLVAAEQSRFVPGDSILVISNKAGPAPVSALRGCTDSIPWNTRAYQLLEQAGLRRAP